MKIPENIKKIWKKRIEGLYHTKNRPTAEWRNTSRKGREGRRTGIDVGFHIWEEEWRKSIIELKGRKAVGCDDRPVEVLKL